MDLLGNDLIKPVLPLLFILSKMRHCGYTSPCIPWFSAYALLINNCFCFVTWMNIIDFLCHLLLFLCLGLSLIYVFHPPPPSPFSLSVSLPVSGQQNCSSHVRRAVVTCFSAGCCGRHGNRPVRYCKRCHVNHHSSEVGASSETHLYQTSPPPINTRECGAEELVCTVESVIRYPHCLHSPTLSLKQYDTKYLYNNTLL